MSGDDTTDRLGIPLDGAERDFDSNNPVTFHPALDQAGVAVLDLVERHRYTLSTSHVDGLETVDPDWSLFPVDAAIRVRTDHVAVDDVPGIYVRGDEGTMLATTDPPTERSFPAGEYYLEVCAPIKLYLRVEGPMTVTATVDGKRVDFDGERQVVVGARSKHEHPAATVTTTTDPADVMAAVSTFGSALKTTSPERSFPTLRGHPPTLELGDQLSIPDGLEPPDTGVTIEIPADYRHVYPVVSLSYFLGATVEPGERPRLTTDAGFTYDLAPGGEFQREVERVLKGTFLLECITRTEGLYDVDLHERHAVEPAVDLEFASLYDRPLADRLESYLSIPYETLAPQVPDWQLTTHVTDDASAIEALPFVVNDLAVVRTGPSRPSEPTSTDADQGKQLEAVDDFLRSSGSVPDVPNQLPIGEATTDSMEHAWVGEGAPRGASKATAAAYRNRLERTPVDGDIGVTVVCNDPAMLDERNVVDEVYGSQETAAVDVTVREQLATDELRATLGADAEFLHYIGHIDERGFECTDGTLDASTLESTGVDAFLLNACTSYDQGMALIDAGAVGGMVTLAKVVNESAVRIGSTAARLLNNGYPLRPALDIARDTSYAGGDYIVVGDGSLAVAHKSTPNLHLHKFESHESGFDLEIVSYSSVTGGMGSMFAPYINESERYHLDSGSIGTFSLSEEELSKFLDLDDIPIEIDGKVRWPNEIDLRDV